MSPFTQPFRASILARARFVEDLVLESRPGIERAAQGSRAAGTPFVSFFMPDEFLEMARSAGFDAVQHVSADALAERYFSGRNDGLRPPSNAESCSWPALDVIVSPTRSQAHARIECRCRARSIVNPDNAISVK